MKAHRVLIVDDHPVFRKGVTAIVDAEPDLEVCAEAANFAEGMEKLRRTSPNIAIVDITLPGRNGIELVKAMKIENPNLLVLVVTVHSDSLYAIRSIRAGARGYVMKLDGADSIIKGIRTVLDGKLYVSELFAKQLIFQSIQTLEDGKKSPVDCLTKREFEIFGLIGAGIDVNRISKSLKLSIKTVETHRSHMKHKLGCMNAAELMKFAIEWKNLHSDGENGGSSNGARKA